MTFSTEYERRIELVQRMVFIKQQEQVLGCLAKKETFHSVAEIAVSYILQSRPATPRPATSLDVSDYHFANM